MKKNYLEPIALNTDNVEVVLEKPLKEYKISEVLQFDLFQQNLHNIIVELKANHKGGNYKRHPIDALMESGLFDAPNITVLYAECLDKKSSLPSSTRKFVLQVGTEAFNKTMARLIKEEKKREEDSKRNGNE